MVDDLEERLTRYRADVDAAVAADLASGRLAISEAGSRDSDPPLLDSDHLMRLEEPTLSAPYERRSPMLIATLGVAAAVTALLIVSLMVGRDDVTTPADVPSPTVTAPPTALPTGLPRPLLNSPGDVPLDPGTYYVDEVTGTPTPRIYATLDSGWHDLDQRPGWQHIAKGTYPDAIGHVGFSNPVAVFLDACHPMDGLYAGPVATVDGFITALMEQQGGWVDVTVPSDISIDGYVGKTFQRTAPADVSDCTARDGGTDDDGQARLPSWDTPLGINDGYSPGQIETLWILDIDGTLVVISTELWPHPSAAAHADFADGVLDSIRIGRP